MLAATQHIGSPPRATGGGAATRCNRKLKDSLFNGLRRRWLTLPFYRSRVSPRKPRNPFLVSKPRKKRAILSVMETCKRLQINLRKYLNDVLPNLAQPHKDDD